MCVCREPSVYSTSASRRGAFIVAPIPRRLIAFRVVKIADRPTWRSHIFRREQGIGYSISADYLDTRHPGRLYHQLRTSTCQFIGRFDRRFVGAERPGRRPSCARNNVESSWSIVVRSLTLSFISFLWCNIFSTIYRLRNEVERWEQY